MSSDFQILLGATLEHLEELRSAGVRSVPIDPRLLQELGRTGHSSAPRRSPAPVPEAPRQQPTPSRPSRPAVPVLAPPAPPPSTVAPLTRPATGTSIAPIPAPPPVVVSPLSGGRPADPAGALEEIRQRALACQLCPHLVRSRTQVVFGVGSPDAELMFVGEAPGAEEDRQGEPFVGPAGQLLTRLIGAMGFSRATVYIANILKCRPDLPPGAWGNRAPRPDEMDTCKPYLMSQIEIIRPKVIVALGLTAVQGLLGLKTSMGAVRGRWHAFRGIPVIPTYHPSYLVRSEDAPDKGFSEKRKTWEDMLQVLTRLERPITEKMRGYFQRPGG